MGRQLLFLSLCACGALALITCSEAETPIPFLDGGPRGAPDAGPVGGRDEPCNGGRCDDDTLSCIQQGSGANAALFCRLECDAFDPDDVCGERSRCSTIAATGVSVCLPANLVGERCDCEGCRCDDDLACIYERTPDAGLSDGRCRFTCTLPSDGGSPDECPPGEGDCTRIIDAGPLRGACVN